MNSKWKSNSKALLAFFPYPPPILKHLLSFRGKYITILSNIIKHTGNVPVKTPEIKIFLACKMAEEVTTLITKPDDLSSVPRTHMQ